MRAEAQERPIGKEGIAGRGRGLGLALVVLATVCWSTSGIFIRFVSDGSGISPVGLAFWRDFSTFLVLLLGLRLFSPSLLRIRRSDLPWLIAMGVLSIASFHALWNISILINGVAVSTAISANAPVFVTLMARLLWGEPLTPTKWFSIGLAVLGIVLISRLDQFGGMRITLGGLAIALMASIAYGSMSIFGKRLTGSYGPWTILVYAFGAAAVALSPFQFGEPVPWRFRPTVLASFAGLVLFTSVIGFGLYTAGLRRLQASVASITSNSEVAFAAILAHLLLGERLDGWQILGAVLVVGGVSMLSLSKLRVRWLQMAKRPP